MYKVYYASDSTGRQFNKNVFCTVVADDRIQALQMAFDLVPYATRWGMVEEIGTSNLDEPESALPAPNTVHVSFWRTGARAGKFSQQAYKVLSCDHEAHAMTIELMPGMPYKVKAEYTKAVA